MPLLLDQCTSCLLGGAMGDALGAAVEFKGLRDILAEYGPEGIAEYGLVYGRRGAITDDTQMTLFTADGLICAAEAAEAGEEVHIPTFVRRAYLRWLRTQGQKPAAGDDDRSAEEGWLLANKDLWETRAPGNTCISSLWGGRVGSIENPLNDSKGCGGVMRIAPVGLAAAEPFRLGCEVAAITHGHPSGYIASGFGAKVIAGLVKGLDLPSAIDSAMAEARSWPGCEETIEAVGKALELAESADATPETVERLGRGWIAEEALAISLFCALRATGFVHGVRLAVNHSGDSDSTGAIAGNLLGLMYGVADIPDHWLAELELRDEIERTAHRLHGVAQIGQRLGA